MLEVALVAETFHCRPSEILLGPMQNWQIDREAWAALMKWREQVSQDVDSR